MSYSASAGIILSTQTASSTYFQLTDHNRQPIQISYDIIDKAARMADGTMRKYVIAKKKKVSVSWSMIPSGTGQPYNPRATTNANNGYTFTVDGNKGGAWMKSFYEQNLFKPILVTVIHSLDNSTTNSNTAFYPSSAVSASASLIGGYSDQFWAFIDNFDYTINKRYGLTDYVDITMSFVEI